MRPIALLFAVLALVPACGDPDLGPDEYSSFDAETVERSLAVGTASDISDDGVCADEDTSTGAAGEISCGVPAGRLKGKSSVTEVCVDAGNCAKANRRYPYCHHVVTRSLWDQLVNNEGTHVCLCKDEPQDASAAGDCPLVVLEGEISEEDVEGFEPSGAKLLLELANRTTK